MEHIFPEDTPTYFADAEASFNESDIVLFGVPFDKTSSYRKGSRYGPDAIRKASWNFESYNFKTNVDLQDHFIHDYGNLSVSNEISANQMIEAVRAFSTSIIEQQKIPVAIGGEHSLSAAVVESFAKNVCVLFLDAHADFRESYQGERYNHACTLRRIVDHVGSDKVFLCGLRSAGKEEYNELTKQNISVSDSYSFFESKKGDIIKEIQSKFLNQPIYVSIDIDVFDPAFAPGTGTPEPFGLFPHDVLRIIDALIPQIIGFDITEINPEFDQGQTSFLGAKMIRHILERLLNKGVV